METLSLIELANISRGRRILHGRKFEGDFTLNTPLSSARRNDHDENDHHDNEGPFKFGVKKMIMIVMTKMIITYKATNLSKY